jgi:hypothetical protein
VAVGAIVGALALAAGLVAGALLLAEGRGGDSSTVVRPEAAAATSPASASTEEELAEEANAPAEEEAGAASSSAGSEAVTPFYGSFYSASIPAGWIQEEDEAWASDGSYIENTWSSPSGDEGLKIDESPGESADPTVSASNIAADLRAAGETVYGVKHGIVRGGVLGSEIAFRASSGLPERVDFFFNLGDDGFAVLGSAYDIEIASQLVDPLVASIQPVGE